VSCQVFVCRGIDFASSYRFWHLILKLFRQCGIFCFCFYYLGTLNLKHKYKKQYTITALCVGKHPDLSTWGETKPKSVDKSGCFPTQRAVIVLLYFCQCLIGYLPCGWKLDCSAGNNRVVSRQRKCLPMFYRLSPLRGEIGLFGGEQSVLFGGEQ
jgi:hypothetical protein